MTEQQLNNVIRGFAEDNRLKISLGHAAILPSMTFRNFISEIVKDKKYVELDASSRKNLSTYLSAMRHLMLEVKKAIPTDNDDGKKMTMHVAEIGAKPPAGYKPQNHFHQGIYDKRLLDGSSGDITDPLHTILSAMERSMGAYSLSPLEKTLPDRASLMALFLAHDDLKEHIDESGTELRFKLARYMSFMNWLVENLPDLQAADNSEAVQESTNAEQTACVAPPTTQTAPRMKRVASQEHPEAPPSKNKGQTTGRR